MDGWSTGLLVANRSFRPLGGHRSHGALAEHSYAACMHNKMLLPATFEVHIFGDVSDNVAAGKRTGSRTVRDAVSNYTLTNVGHRHSSRSRVFSGISTSISYGEEKSVRCILCGPSSASWEYEPDAWQPRQTQKGRDYIRNRNLKQHAWQKPWGDLGHGHGEQMSYFGCPGRWRFQAYHVAEPAS